LRLDTAEGSRGGRHLERGYEMAKTYPEFPGKWRPHFSGCGGAGGCDPVPDPVPSLPGGRFKRIKYGDKPRYHPFPDGPDEAPGRYWPEGDAIPIRCKIRIRL
ncbi:MAG: hypothetical protein ACFFCW_38460, partial [Candidatus Hodarchaeota archaeon]